MLLTNGNATYEVISEAQIDAFKESGYTEVEKPQKPPKQKPPAQEPSGEANEQK